MRPRRRWTAREAATATFFVAYVAVQVLLPIRQLTAGGFRRFGWQMFARANTPPAFVAVRADGSRVDLALDRRIGNWRGDLDWSDDGIARQLCGWDPGAVEILVLTRDDGPDRGVPCP